MFITFVFFFFNYTSPSEIYTLSLHDALPISHPPASLRQPTGKSEIRFRPFAGREDRKSTRLNSSHDQISYAVFCLKKKKRAERIAQCDYPWDVLQALLYN